MEKEIKSLSEKGKIFYDNRKKDIDGRMIEQTWYHKKNVKEFIKKRNELDYMLQRGLIDLKEYHKRRDELAGSKLI